MAWRMASPRVFCVGPAAQGFEDHLYAVAVSNKRDRWANNQGPVLELGMPSALRPASSKEGYPPGKRSLCSSSRPRTVPQESR